MLNKKILSLSIIGLSLVAAVLVMKFNKSGVTVTSLNDIYVNDDKYNSIISSYQMSDAALTTEIQFNDEPLIYDSDTNTFYYSVIENSETGFNPSVMVGATSLENEDGAQDSEETTPTYSIFAHGAAITDELIASNGAIQIILTNGANVSVSNLVCTTLPVMNVTLDDETVASLGLDDTYDIISFAPSSVYVYDNRADFDGVSRVTTSDAKIRRHGQSTAGYPLKGYRFSLLADKNDFDGEKVKANILGLREDDDWILSASYRDYEKVRNVFSMNLWYESCTKENEWEVNNSTQYKFIELFFNGHYHGLYAICYRIDQKELKTNENESTFKKKDWTLSELDTQLTYQEYEDGTGTYLLPGYSLKAGDADDYNTLLTLYMNMNYSADPNIVRMTSDVDNSIDLWLFYKLTQAVDNVYGGNAKNMYVSIKESDTGITGYKLLFTPWDMDQTWRYTSPSVVGQYSMPEYDLPLEWGTVYRLQCLGDATINEEIKARYAELRSGAWSDESIMAMLDEYESDIYDSGAFARTQAKFMEGSYNESSLKLSEFKAYVQARLNCMDAYVNAL
ncbi:MAG: hypothetical protein E7276_02385 [Pseudobutyrivibrio sp.]|nr:hypothetical protein [Pseudobutyrivibrio sp.]